MKRALLAGVLTMGCLFAQSETKQIFTMSTIGPGFSNTVPVQGAPYSATIVNESIQTLADGNRIVNRTSGATARDSQGRTRQDTALPPIGNMTADKAPHMVFINDPVSQTSYTLNLTDKTAHKMPVPPAPPGASGRVVAGANIKMLATGPITAGLAAPGLQAEAGTVMYREFIGKDQGQAKTEDLGSQTIEGVMAQGTRTTRTIPAGEIGNDKPIDVVSEVWTSPELKTIVYSKRSDPRMGEQTFRLTNIQRAEPDASLFTVPPDFKVLDINEPGQNVMFYRKAQ